MKSNKKISDNFQETIDQLNIKKHEVKRSIATLKFTASFFESLIKENLALLKELEVLNLQEDLKQDLNLKHKKENEYGLLCSIKSSVKELENAKRHINNYSKELSVVNKEITEYRIAGFQKN